MLSSEQLRAFGRDGYIVVPAVIDEQRQAAALTRIDELLHDSPPADGHTGPHSYWREIIDEPALAGLLAATPAMEILVQLLAPRLVEVRPRVQVALTFPPFDHMPGRGHIDGLTPPEPDGRPGTFTMLAGIVLSDQTQNMSGNLVTWPGSHHQLAEHLRQAGPDAIITEGGLQPVDHSRPVQVHASPGDFLIASYLLSHNIGGNLSDVIRKTVYFRIIAQGHNERWRDVVTDPLLEFPAVHAATN